MPYSQIDFKGGAVMIILILCGILAVYLFLEKLIQLHRDKVNVRELITGLVNVLKRDGMIEAITLCDTTPGPVAKILNAAIQAYQNDDDIRQAIDDAAAVEVPRLESRLNILATIAYVSPLLGLLGTVLAMAQTFQAQAIAGTSIKFAELSGGMTIALFTTAAGLCIAIPCNIAYNFLVSKVQALCMDMEKASSEILYFFKHHRKNGSEEK